MGATIATLSPDRLLKEMSELWMQTGKQGQEAGGVLRACTMTLVVAAEEEQGVSSLGETIAALMPEHPARTIIVRLSRTAQQPSALVTAQCWMPFGQRQEICCEQIEITAPEGSFEDVASVIAPIAAPDLPLVVWCRSPRIFERDEFKHLAAIARKVVVDTTAVSDAKAALQRLARMSASGLIVGDLSWTHLTRWRETISQVFENAQYASRLAEITRVLVKTTDSTMAASALYMGAWLMGALQSAGAKAELVSDPRANESSIELTGTGFRVQLIRQGNRLVTAIDQLSHCTSLPQPTECQLVREELRIIRHDPIFERTLSAAARLSKP
jgi:glucose-6-phosphate dehydrogenase assembly protein OpcA